MVVATYQEVTIKDAIMFISILIVVWIIEVRQNIISLRRIRPKLVVKIIHISNRIPNSKVQAIKIMVHILNLLLRTKQPVKKLEMVIYTTIDLRKILEAFRILWAQVHTWFKISNSRLSNKICHMELHQPNACRVTWLHNQAPIQPINTEPFSHQRMSIQ